MKIIFLGTNGWYSTPTGNTPCILIDSKDHYVVLDAGNGIYKLDKYITEDKPISMFISHFHLDHTSGLHTLMKFNFKQGINVYVGENRTKDFQKLVNPPFTIGIENNPENIQNLRVDVRVYELTEKEEYIPFKVQAMKLHHAYGGHGYRMEIEGKTISYSGDCGFTDEVKNLAQNADLLIAECTNKEKPNPEWGHLDPKLAGKLAKDTNVKQLILTHFDASIFTDLKDRAWAEQEAKKVFQNVIAATDDTEIEL